MKILVSFTTLVLAIILSTSECHCQIRNILKNTKKETTKNINKNINEGLNNILNKNENEKVEQSSEEVKKEGAAKPSEESKNETEAKPAGNASPMLVWAKYDFVPGDKIIFEDVLSGEENGEFPSRWDLVEGNVENAVFGNENVIMFRGGHPTIVPYLKNSNIDYLPDVFTVEFDLYLPSNSFYVYFYDRKNQEAISGSNYLSIWENRMSMGSASSQLPGGAKIDNKWAHIAIAYTDGKFKAYIDETRLINIPRLEFNPTGISFHAYTANDNNRFYIKNIRFSEGGVKYYDRFIQDGKIVSNGIRFDTGKSTLRPESMGVLNEIYAMMAEHPEIKLSIEGHTDSDGDNDLNLQLSRDRAVAVLNQLVSMGISGDRLTSKGLGENNPVGPNDTPEGKAANRRVEFLKVE